MRLIVLGHDVEDVVRALRQHEVKNALEGGRLIHEVISEKMLGVATDPKVDFEKLVDAIKTMAFDDYEPVTVQHDILQPHRPYGKQYRRSLSGSRPKKGKRK